MTVHGHWTAWIHWPQLQVAITCQHHLATKPSADKVKSLWLPPCTTTSPRQTKWVGEMIGFKRHLSLHYLILSLQYCKRSFCSCNFPICPRHIRIIQNLTISDSFFETSRHTNPSLTIYPALIAAHPRWLDVRAKVVLSVWLLSLNDRGSETVILRVTIIVISGMPLGEAENLVGCSICPCWVSFWLTWRGHWKDRTSWHIHPEGEFQAWSGEFRIFQGSGWWMRCHI